MKETMTVRITFDLDKVNNALGNTPNVTAENALMELFNGMLTEYGCYDSYGDPYENPPHLEKHVTFEICQETQ